jgi:hypothetical protein
MDRRVAWIIGSLLVVACDDDSRSPVTAPAPEPPPPFVLYTSTPAAGDPVHVTCTSDGHCRGLSWTIHVARMPADATALRTLFFDQRGRECAVGVTDFRRINNIDAFMGTSFVLQCELPFTTSSMGVQMLNSRRDPIAGGELRGVGWTFTVIPVRDPD